MPEGEPIVSGGTAASVLVAAIAGLAVGIPLGLAHGRGTITIPGLSQHGR